MPEHGIRSTYSKCPFQLLMRGKYGEILSSASAFFFETDGNWFLITNWHVVSGRNFLTGKPLAQQFEVISLTAKLASYDIGNRKKGTFGIGPLDIPLYYDEQPAWFEHPELGNLCDVVAIPVDRPSACPKSMHNAANRISEDKIPVEPGCNLFVIGFPCALSIGPGLPIWKSGYVASEPHFDVDLDGKLQKYGGLAEGTRIPAFFIDAQTRTGMSGAPVFARYHGCWDTQDPYRSVNFTELSFQKWDNVVISGYSTMFIGCYSGRAGIRESEATLGLCWRTDIIEAICRGSNLGKNPHIIYRQ